MPKKAEKLLEGMRISTAKWKRKDLVSLYNGYEFVIDTSKKNHDMVWHPKYPELVTFLPRHKKLGEYLVNDAVKLIDRLEYLESQGVGGDVQ